MRKIKAVWTKTGLRQAAHDLTERGALFISAPLNEPGSTLKLIQLKQYLRSLKLDTRFERRDDWVNVTLSNAQRSHVTATAEVTHA